MPSPTAIAATVLLTVPGLLTAPLGAQPLSVERLEAFADLARLGGTTGLGSGHVGLTQAVLDAQTDLCVAFVASHPDDQYVLPAALLRYRYGYRVAVVLLTRGEGGQNSAGPEVGDALGRLRTLETEACARRLGFEVWYLNRPDLGYTRTGEEALRQWGREATTGDLARLLREIRPDVVMTTHHPQETHGHDLALLEVLGDAVALACDPEFDPSRRPAAIRSLFRGATADEPNYSTLPVEDQDGVRGESYVSLAWAALTEEHASAAPFRPPQEFFTDSHRFVPLPVPGRPPVRDLHEGVPTLFQLLRGHLSDPEIAELRRTFEIELRDAIVDRPRLLATALRLRRALAALEPATTPDLEVRLARRRAALERVAIHALGLHAEIELTGEAIAVPGEDLPFRVQVSCSSAGLPDVRGLRLTAPGGVPLRVTETADPGRPQPWTLAAIYAVPDDALATAPLQDLYRKTRFEMPLRCELVASVRAGSRVEEIRMPLELPTTVRPAVELIVHPDGLVVPDGVVEVPFNVRVRRNTASQVRGQLTVQTLPGSVVVPASRTVSLRTEREVGYLFTLRVPENLQHGPHRILVSLGRFDVVVPLRRVAVHVPDGLRVGLIEGVDDTARTILGQLGCELVLLGERELPTRSLADLDTILIDIRALSHHASARAEFQRLLGFARAGGRLVVLYHKDTEIAAAGFDPFPEELPLRIGTGRVTQEDAPVVARIEDHPLLSTPNQIRTDDWDGWVQERGLYFPSEWDAAYDAVLSMADAGQPPEHGSLLHARVGEGEFIYCALALYRQLKNGHPGACRLFANLVAADPRRR